MKPRMHQAVAIVAAALVMPIAWAQSDQLANPPGTDAPTYVPEPTASPSRTDGADGELANALVEEMNADASLKGSKIVVQPENGKVTLSGVTMTTDQAKHAAGIAAAKVGVENVINAIRPSDV